MQLFLKKHCNFFVNNGKAKSSDIEKLINKVKQTVNDKTGINLELEIKIIGEKKNIKGDSYSRGNIWRERS